MAEQNEQSETVTCTINGVEITVPKGTRMIDAAARVGIDVPHYCYHPSLSAPAQCRMCLVEVEGVAEAAARLCLTGGGWQRDSHAERKSARGA